METSRDKLKVAFELVENKEHWKNPIDAKVPLDVDIDLIAEAVPFFTGTPAIITQNKNHYQVQADGYWAGPCA